MRKVPRQELFMIDRSTAAMAAKSDKGLNPQFSRQWGDPQELVAAALRRFAEPAKLPRQEDSRDRRVLNRLLSRFHADHAAALPEIAARITKNRELLSAFSQWVQERADAKCNDARILLAAGKPRRKGRSPAARARRRRAANIGGMQ
jgi:hypothetical protein